MPGPRRKSATNELGSVIFDFRCRDFAIVVTVVCDVR